MSQGRRVRRLLDYLVEDVVTGLVARDELELRREELARGWAERVATLDPDAAVLVAPAQVRRLDQLSYAIVADERRPPADLPDVDLEDWWDGFYRLRLELYVAAPTTLTYELAGELSARPWDNAPGERRGLELGSVSVREGLRGGRLGACLVRELVARARFQEVDSITVAVSPGWSAPDAYERLVGFYRRLGFRAGPGRRMRLDLRQEPGRSPAGQDRPMLGQRDVHERLAAVPLPVLVELAPAGAEGQPIIEPAGDPCAGQERNHVVRWYRQGGVLYPLRCGKRAPAGWGYLHIRDDVPRAGEPAHGDPLADPAFDLEMRDVLERGVEAAQGGGNWRYTLRYEGDQCADGWGFRVVLAKLPLLPDGHPAGIITAFRLDAEPTFFP